MGPLSLNLLWICWDFGICGLAFPQSWEMFFLYHLCSLSLLSFCNSLHTHWADTLLSHFLAYLTYFLLLYLCYMLGSVSSDLLSFNIFIYYVFISQNSVIFCFKFSVSLFIASCFCRYFQACLVFYFFTCNRHNCFKFTSDNSSLRSGRVCVCRVHEFSLATACLPWTGSWDWVLPAPLQQVLIFAEILWGQRWRVFLWDDLYCFLQVCESTTIQNPLN